MRCPSRPVRQDRLDAMVWRELVRLLEEPALIEAELERRLEAGLETDPQRRRRADLRSERERLERAGARLVTAYQEELITLDELRSRMPAIHSRKRVLEAELEAIQSAAEERERFLRIAETLESFRDRLRASAETLELIERQKVLRSLVKEVLVGDGEITIRHSIPMTEGSGCSHAKPDSNSSTQSPEPQGYVLRWGSLERTLLCLRLRDFETTDVAERAVNLRSNAEIVELVVAEQGIALFLVDRMADFAVALLRIAEQLKAANRFLAHRCLVASEKVAVERRIAHELSPLEASVPCLKSLHSKPSAIPRSDRHS